LGGGAGAGIEKPECVQTRPRCVIAADLDTAAQRILALPALAPQFLADDDGGRGIRLVLLAESAAQQDRNAESLEVVLADDILPRVVDRARTSVVITCRGGGGAGKRHAAAHHERHGYGPGEAGGGDRR